MSAILEIKGLRGGYTPEVEILRGIDITLQQGEACGIIGLNGSGKSTLGKAIMNMIPIRSGQILFKGEDVTSLTTSELANRGIAIMLQGGQVFPNLSVFENLQLAYGNSPDKKQIATLKATIPLLAASKKILQGKMADKLSGGQRHQLALAMTLAQCPQIVILDEPSAGLSPGAINEIYTLLDKVRNLLNVTILLIEQNINKIIQYSNRCFILSYGQIVFEITDKDNSIEYYIDKQIG